MQVNIFGNPDSLPTLSEGDLVRLHNCRLQRRCDKLQGVGSRKWHFEYKVINREEEAQIEDPEERRRIERLRNWWTTIGQNMAAHGLQPHQCALRNLLLNDLSIVLESGLRDSYCDDSKHRSSLAQNQHQNQHRSISVNNQFLNQIKDFTAQLGWTDLICKVIDMKNIW